MPGAGKLPIKNLSPTSVKSGLNGLWVSIARNMGDVVLDLGLSPAKQSLFADIFFDALPEKPAQVSPFLRTVDSPVYFVL